jgi:twinkle protein
MNEQPYPLETIKRLARRGTHKMACPFCHHTHTKANRHAKDMTVTSDWERIVYNCHRCFEKGLIKLQDNVVKMEPRAPEPKRQEKDGSELPALTTAHYEWLASRGVSKEVADDYKLFASNQFNAQTAIGFPYFGTNGRVNAVKSRLVSDKKFLCWQAPISFFGIEKVPVGQDLFIVEGEMDVLAMAAIGVSAISVPNGAPAKLSSEGKLTPEEDTKFRFLWNAKEHIEKARRVILATDTDAPGNALAEEIARRVGKAKCWRIKWEGGKDANEILLKEGCDSLVKQAMGGEPWPVEGLFAPSHFGQAVEDLYRKGLGRGASVGYQGVDDLYTVVEGQVTIVTGIPSSGKSEFIDQIMVNMATDLKWKFAICSFENEPRLHIAKLISKKLKRPFFTSYGGRRIDEEEMRAGLDWVNENFVFLHQENGDLSALDSILERGRAAVLRYGIRGMVIDPYNFISRPRDMSETDWVSEMLTRVKVFATSHGVHVWFVAHPTKLQKNADGKIPPPGGYDISGSAAWYAKADCGLTIHRDVKENPHETQVHLWKVRFSWVGKQGETRLQYDPECFTYFEGPPQEEAQGEEFL